MEVRKEGERGKGRGKVGKPCRKDSIGRKRSWNVSGERRI